MTKYYKRKVKAVTKNHDIWNVYLKVNKIMCPEIGSYLLDMWMRYEGDQIWRKVYLPERDLNDYDEISKENLFLELL